MASIENRVRAGEVRWYARFLVPTGEQKGFE
jgi:hypothetical protein